MSLDTPPRIDHFFDYDYDVASAFGTVIRLIVICTDLLCVVVMLNVALYLLCLRCRFYGGIEFPLWGLIKANLIYISLTCFQLTPHDAHLDQLALIFS